MDLKPADFPLEPLFLPDRQRGQRLVDQGQKARREAHERDQRAEFFPAAERQRRHGFRGVLSSRYHCLVQCEAGAIWRRPRRSGLTESRRHDPRARIAGHFARLRAAAGRPRHAPQTRREAVARRNLAARARPRVGQRQTGPDEGSHQKVVPQPRAAHAAVPRRRRRTQHASAQVTAVRRILPGVHRAVRQTVPVDRPERGGQKLQRNAVQRQDPRDRRDQFGRMHQQGLHARTGFRLEADA